MVNPGEKLHEIFGIFNSRLYQIKQIEEIQPDTSGKLFLEDAISNIQKLPPETILPYLGHLITIIGDINPSDHKYKSIVIKRYMERSPFNPFEYEDKKVYQKRIKNFANLYCKEISTELNSYLEQLKILNQKLNEDINSLGESIKTDKLQFNISVKEMAVLFRLLKDADILPQNLENKELAYKISNSFSSKKDGGSAVTMSKHLSTFDEKALEFWKIKFNELSKLAQLALDKGLKLPFNL